MKLILLALHFTACFALVSVRVPNAVLHDDAKIISKIDTSVTVILLTFPELYRSNHDLSLCNKLMLRWKNYLLGDGGVYFDQRPKALRELNTHLSFRLMSDIAHHYKDEHVKVESAVISTCARFEVIVTLEMKSSSPSINFELRDSILRILSEQMVSFRCKTKGKKLKFIVRRAKYFMFKVIPFLPRDNCRRVYNDDICEDWLPQIDAIWSDLSKTVLMTSEVKEICRRLCYTASGLDRPIFRPFSARDSHIVYQMKRSSEAVIRSQYNLSESSSTYCKILFDTALQSSKAARSPKVLPILDDLRLESKGVDGPIELSKLAADAAKLTAIEPAVRNCCKRFQSLERSNDIAYFRHLASEIVSRSGFKLESDECASIRRILHQPMIDMKNGIKVPPEEVLYLVQNEINKMIKD